MAAKKAVRGSENQQSTKAAVRGSGVAKMAGRGGEGSGRGDSGRGGGGGGSSGGASGASGGTEPRGRV